MQGWYRDLFGADYLRMDWHNSTETEVESLVGILDLQPGMRVLDLCCGYGRHAIPLAQQGCDVIGVDLSEPLLRHAQREAAAQEAEVQWIRADARALPVLPAFDVALNLFTAFGYFEKEGENLRVLQEVEAALKPGGWFVLDTVNHDYLVRHFERQSWYERDDVFLLERRAFDHRESRVYGTWTLVEKEGEQRTYPHSIRTYTFAELRLLLTLAGLDVVQVYGGYQKEPLDWDAPRMVVISRKRLGDKG
jgi:SAM-dependent methyltransferase